MNRAEVSTELFEILHDSALTWRVIDAAEAKERASRGDVGAQANKEGSRKMKADQKVSTLSSMLGAEASAIIEKSWREAEEKAQAQTKEKHDRAIVTLKQADPIGTFMAAVGIGPHKVGKKSKRSKDPIGTMLSGITWR